VIYSDPLQRRHDCFPVEVGRTPCPIRTRSAARRLRALRRLSPTPRAVWTLRYSAVHVNGAADMLVIEARSAGRVAAIATGINYKLRLPNRR